LPEAKEVVTAKTATVGKPASHTGAVSTEDASTAKAATLAREEVVEVSREETKAKEAHEAMAAMIFPSLLLAVVSFMSHVTC
jgi:hypothetical protein